MQPFGFTNLFLKICMSGKNAAVLVGKST